MQITRQADYAVRAVLHVAQLKEDERLATSVIAEEENIPLPFLAKIVSQLSVKGILDAMRGASGGVRLARDPENISLLEVIEAIDGEISLNRCVLNEDACPTSVSCPVREIWCDVQKELVARLEKTTFAQLLKRQEDLQHDGMVGEPA
jgi:Rrf2 family protein